MIRRAPLLWLAIAFSAGIALPAWAVLLLIAAIGILWRPPPADLLVLVLAAALGMARAGVDRLPAPGSIAGWVQAGGRPVHLAGTLLSDPEQQGRMVRGWLKTEKIRIGEEWQKVSGKVQARWPARTGVFEAGDRLELMGWLRPGVPARPDRLFDEARWLWLKTATGVLTVSDPEGISRLEAATGIGACYRRWIGRFHRRLKAIPEEMLVPDQAGLLNGLLLGDGRGISRDVWEAFKKTGTVHVLVVSGLHVGLVGMIQLVLLSAMGVPRVLRYGLLAAGLVTYGVLAGMNPPIARATFTGLLLCWAWARGVEHSPLNLVGAAALAMLAVDPRLLRDPGFQLSFASVAAILAVDPWLVSWAKTPAGRALFRPLALSCAAWMATLPILLVQFSRFSWMAPFLNLLVIPWASLLIGVGALVYAAGLTVPPLGPFFSAVFSVLASGFTGFVEWVAH